MKVSFAGYSRVLLLCALSLPVHAEFGDEVKLTTPDASGGDRFGIWIDMSADTMVAGASENRDGPNFGAAYVYVLENGAWGLQTKLLSPDTRPFGRTVAIDGDTIVVGALEDRAAFGGQDAGMAYVFTRASGTWSLQAELVSTDVPIRNRWADAVAIEGDLIAVGMTEDQNAGFFSGATYLFRRAGGTWVQEAKLAPADAAAGSNFGSDVAISDGRVAVGARTKEVGGVSLAGAAYLFERLGGTWVQQARIIAPNPGAGGIFARSLDLSGDTLVATKPEDPEAGPSAGAAFVYREQADGSWQLEQKLIGSDTTSFNSFGSSVSMLDGQIVVGAPNSSSSGVGTSGAVYVFERDSTGWREVQRLIASDPTTFAGYGFAVEAAGEVVVVGAHFHERNNGAVYIYTAEEDTEPPLIDDIEATPGELWPPNNKMVAVTLKVEAHDDSGASECRIVQVQSDGPGAAAGDVEVTGPLTLKLRASRNPRGSTRTYTITVECRDAAGNSTVGTTTVRVPGERK
jgi:hypothetical protein